MVLMKYFRMLVERISARAQIGAPCPTASDRERLAQAHVAYRRGWCSGDRCGKATAAPDTSEQFWVVMVLMKYFRMLVDRISARAQIGAPCPTAGDRERLAQAHVCFWRPRQRRRRSTRGEGGDPKCMTAKNLMKYLKKRIFYSFFMIHAGSSHFLTDPD